MHEISEYWKRTNIESIRTRAIFKTARTDKSGLSGKFGTEFALSKDIRERIERMKDLCNVQHIPSVGKDKRFAAAANFPLRIAALLVSTAGRQKGG